MNANPSQTLTIGISARALFDLEAEDEVLRAHGSAAYRRFQIEHEGDPLPVRPGLGVIEALQKGAKAAQHGVDLVVLSESQAAVSLRFLEAARQRDLDVGRAAFTGGEPLTRYLQAFRVDLFLSGDAQEIGTAMEAGIPAALVQAGGDPTDSAPTQIRVALDGRSVTAALEGSDRSDAARDSEEDEAPLPEVPVPRWIRAVAGMQRVGGEDGRLVSTALVSCQAGADRERILSALRRWEVDLDQAFFTEAAARNDLLATLRPHLVFGVLRRGQDDSLLDAPLAQGDEEKSALPRYEGLSSSFSRLRLRS